MSTKNNHYNELIDDALDTFGIKRSLSEKGSPYDNAVVEAGIKEIQERLGHSDVNTTMNIYAHMTKNIEKKTSHKFSQLTKGLI